ncbi:TPA: RNA-binding protein [Candidatus Woesearchaeota archaeon]|nr:RNA-binding protein [Candidatus Woesearchaeota archaeon]
MLVADKSIVVPGEEVAVGMDFLPTEGVYRDGEKLVASRLGLLSVDGRLVKLIPLAGKYLPKRGDVIVGKVVDVLISGWRIDINSAYTAMLSMKDATSEFIARGADLTRYFTFGDYIVTNIVNVTSQNLVDLTMKGPGLRKLSEGRVITVAPNKVPRIIGKQGSMVGMVKDATGCRITVGQNGIVWLQGEPSQEALAVAAIRKVESESHISGLTERIKAFLDDETKKLQAALNV